MKIESVTAIAFGPFSGDVLNLGPGMNVVHGPNESGKSSWHAAIYAAICGIRRARGRGRSEDQTFTTRHRPWRGRAWQVTALVLLDSGVQLEIDQRLGAGGRSTVTDRNSKRSLATNIEREGAADASTLLGLSRETAAATMFVRQAEILQVLTGAEALQEYLERAAASASVDTTADEALTALAALKKDKVGLRRVGSKSPLMLADSRLKNAQEALENAETQFESYQSLRESLIDLTEALEAAEAKLAAVRRHEEERSRRERWRGIVDLERQLDSARGLQEQLISIPDEPEPDARLGEAITGVLDTLTRLPAIPPAADGPSVEELRHELSQLPALPAGDLEPAGAVTQALDSWRTARSVLTSHQDSQPKLDESAATEQALAADEVARLESELSGLLALPDGDREPARAVTTALDEWSRCAASFETHLAGAPESPSETGSTSDEGPTAEELESELARLPSPPDGDREVAESVGQLFAKWREACAVLEAHVGSRPMSAVPSRSDEAAEGQSIAELRAQLSELPEQPSGDLEPAADARSAFESWSRADDRVLAHAESRPETGTPIELPAPAGQLRRLLDDLAATAPEPLSAPDNASGKAPLARTASSSSSLVPLIGGVLAIVVGAIVLATMQPVVGAVILAVGLAVTGLGLVSRRNQSNPATASELVPEDRASSERAATRAERAKAVLADLGLPADSAEVSRLIAASEKQAAAEALVESWRQREGDVRKALAHAASHLHDQLARRGVVVVETGDLRAAYDLYEQQCRERAEVARRADKRTELQSLLRAREAMEDGEQRRLVEAQQALQDWEEREAKLTKLSHLAADALRRELSLRGVPLEEDADPQDGYDRYVVACRERATLIAHHERQRHELESRLEARRALDAGARQRHADAQAVAGAWERRRTDLEEALSSAASELRSELAMRGVVLGEDEDLRGGYGRYLAECQDRAEAAAGQTKHRHELETLLVTQRGLQRGALQRLQDSQARLDTWRNSESNFEAEVSKQSDHLRTELNTRGVAVSEDETLQAAFDRYVDECRKRAGVARQAARRTELTKLLESREASERSREQIIRAHREAHARIDELAKSTGSVGTSATEKADALRAWLGLQQQKGTVRSKRRELQARLNELLDGGSIEQRAHELDTQVRAAGARPATLDSLPSRADEADAETRRARDLRDQARLLAGKLEEAEGYLTDVAAAIENEQRAQDDVDALTVLAADFDMTIELLQAAKDKAHANIAPLLNKTLRPWIPRVTGGRYDDVRIDSKTLELQVRDSIGQFRPATNLSYGTEEQLFLLLRIALAEHLATGNEVAPLILDDVTVHADAKRTRAMLDLIHELSAERQVVLFSQEETVLAWAQAALKEDCDRLIRLAPAGA